MDWILVTGGAGFIGSHTVKALLERRYRVRVLDTLDPQVHGSRSGFPFEHHPHLACVRGDVRDPLVCERAMKDVQAVYHFAACTGVGQSMYDLGRYASVNVTGTATLLEAAVKARRSLKRFVLASSRAVYGEGTHHCVKHDLVYPRGRTRVDLEDGNLEPRCPVCGQASKPRPTAEDRPLYPNSFYGWTKKQQEEQCAFAAETFGLPVTTLRYFNVYGSGQSLRNPYTGIVSIFYSRLKSGRPIHLYEGGRPLRDFVHVSDVVRANLLALEERQAMGAPLNVGSGARHSVGAVARALAEASGLDSQFQDHGEFRMGDIHACFADGRKIQQRLGFRACVGLKAGMREFVSWARGELYYDEYPQMIRELKRFNLLGTAEKRAAATS